MTTLADLRYALRVLAKSPGFTAVAILTLALGIGANTAIFTVVNALLLRSLPYRDASRLVVISTAGRERGVADALSFPRYTKLSEQNRSFTGIAAFTQENFQMGARGGEPEQVRAARVTAKFFDVLGVQPAAGRFFSPDEDQPGGKNVVLISHAFWMRRFGGAADVVGRSISLDSRDYAIIGILPAGFTFASDGLEADVWAPRVFDLSITNPDSIRRGAGFLTVIARLKPEIAREQAQAEMDVLNRQYQHDNAGLADADPRLRILVTGLREKSVAGLRSGLLLLTAAVAFVLLIACANVASLLLARAVGRKREIAVRTALGARRGALLRQLLTESVVLALASGILGALLSVWGTHVLSTLTAETLPQVSSAHVDPWALAFTAAISLACGLLFGIAPALELSRPDLNATLREDSRGTVGSRSGNLARRFLVVVQVALSTILLVGAGLMLRSFVRLQTTSPGFDPKNVLTMRISLPPTKYKTRPQMIAFYNEALRQVSALPGIESAAISSALPASPSRLSPMLLEGQPTVPLAQRPILHIQTISPNYARVLRVPLVNGRVFTEHDDADAPFVAMVNQAVVRHYWPGENPVGKRIWLGQLAKPAEVVGVLGDVKNSSLAADANPEIFLPFPQLPWLWLNLSAHTSQDPQAMISAVRQRIWSVDKDQPITNARSMEDLLASAGAQPRFLMMLLGVFSTIAFVLAVVGLYGVVAYSVAQRTGELAIRMALGAREADILKLVMSQGLGLTFGGIVIGLAGSLALTRLMSSLLYKTSATDAATFASSAALFLLVAAAASLLPALRALRTDPADALRYE